MGGEGGIHWAAELRASQGLLSSTRRFHYSVKYPDSQNSPTQMFTCVKMDLGSWRDLSPLFIGVVGSHPPSHRWHELEFLCYSVDSGVQTGSGAHPVQCVPDLFLGGKAAAAWP